MTVTVETDSPSPPLSDRDVLQAANGAWARGELQSAYDQIVGRFGAAPVKPPVAVGLARLLVEMGRFEEAGLLTKGLQVTGQEAAIEGIRAMALIASGATGEGRKELEALVAEHPGFMPYAAVPAGLDFAAKKLESTSSGFETLSGFRQEAARALVWNGLSRAAHMDFTSADACMGAAERIARLETERRVRPAGGDAIRFTPISFHGPTVEETLGHFGGCGVEAAAGTPAKGRVAIVVLSGQETEAEAWQRIKAAADHLHLVGPVTSSVRAAAAEAFGEAVSVEASTNFGAGGADSVALARGYLWLKGGTASSVLMLRMLFGETEATSIVDGISRPTDAGVHVRDTPWLVPWRRFDLDGALFENSEGSIRFLGRAVARLMRRPSVDEAVDGDRWLAQSALFGAWYETVVVREEPLIIGAPLNGSRPPVLDEPLSGTFQPTAVELLSLEEPVEISRRFRDARLAGDVAGMRDIVDGMDRNRRLRWRNIYRDLSSRLLTLRETPVFGGAAPPDTEGQEALLREPGIRGWTARRLVETPMTYDPFPFGVIEDLLPPDTYAEILSELPDPDTLAWGTNNDYPDRGEIVSAGRTTVFGPRTREALSLFNDGPMLELLLDRLGLERVISLSRDAGFEPMIGAKLTMDRTKYSLGPHMDSERRLATVLYYLPATDADKDVGTLICRPKPGIKGAGYGLHGRFEHYDILGQAPYAPNTAFAFANVDEAYHGVRPIDRTLIRPMIQYTVYLVSA